MDRPAQRNKIMEIKASATKAISDDFYYDLFFGGYIKPEDFLSKPKDIECVLDAIKTINEFETLLRKNGLLDEE